MVDATPRATSVPTKTKTAAIIAIRRVLVFATVWRGKDECRLPPTPDAAESLSRSGRVHAWPR